MIDLDNHIYCQQALKSMRLYFGDRNTEMFVDRMVGEHKYNEIAEKWGVTQVRVRQIVERIKAQLPGMLEPKHRFKTEKETAEEIFKQAISMAKAARKSRYVCKTRSGTWKALCSPPRVEHSHRYRVHPNGSIRWEKVPDVCS